MESKGRVMCHKCSDYTVDLEFNVGRNVSC